jgi:succinate dehydrogenase flavoprotein subunit
MSRYDPEHMERATRDVISRSSFLEIIAGRGTEHGGVLIDASHLGEATLMRSFPGMVERCRTYGFDLLHGPVEVSPSAHYQMGGIKIDKDCRTQMEGLFAAGEDAGGVHGANRLGGNGVADSIVFGARAGDTMAEFAAGAVLREISAAEVEERAKKWSGMLKREHGESAFALRAELEVLMWDKVGIVRDGRGLQFALDELQSLCERAQRLKVSGDPAFNLEWNEAINAENLALVGQMVARSALFRQESRGAHYRSDFPAPNPQWLKRACLVADGDGARVSVEPIDFTRMKPPELSLAQAEGSKQG